MTTHAEHMNLERNFRKLPDIPESRLFSQQLAPGAIPDLKEKIEQGGLKAVTIVHRAQT